MSAPDLLKPIPGTHTLWAELPFAAHNEHVRHLTDLLLRRVRIGLLTPNYGSDSGGVKKLCRPYLPWSSKQWKKEINQYMVQCRHAHGLPLRIQVTYAKQAPPITNVKAFCAYYARKLFSKA